MKSIHHLLRSSYSSSYWDQIFYQFWVWSKFQRVFTPVCEPIPAGPSSSDSALSIAVLMSVIDVSYFHISFECPKFFIHIILTASSSSYSVP